jgi:hypothetical protein
MDPFKKSFGAGPAPFNYNYSWSSRLFTQMVPKACKCDKNQQSLLETGILQAWCPTHDWESCRTVIHQQIIEQWVGFERISCILCCVLSSCTQLENCTRVFHLVLIDTQGIDLISTTDQMFYMAKILKTMFCRWGLKFKINVECSSARFADNCGLDQHGDIIEQVWMLTLWTCIVAARLREDTNSYGGD